MRETKYWTWHMAAGVVILFLLGLHMLIMHVGGITHLFVPYGGEAVSKSNSLFRDSRLFFTVTYILLLGVALYHGLYGLRTILFELTLKPIVEKAITFVFLVVGLGLFGLGTWAATTAHTISTAAAHAAGAQKSHNNPVIPSGARNLALRAVDQGRKSGPDSSLRSE
jgi:succinate dehydrogenase / fumarate reductase membrane anchor subunit